MLRKFILLNLLCFFILGCNDSVDTIEAPEGPRHDLLIDGNVKFQAEIRWSAASHLVQTDIKAKNIGADTARIETGPCAFNVIAYTKEGEAVWYNRPPDQYICTDEMLIYKIAPEETRHLSGQMYISGQSWHHDMPEGDWIFKVESRTEQGERISFDAHSSYSR
ncbi:hypothetical protein [Gracilimonas sp. BCB1]|uniref:hypothetical protein n=1 Tax=Gracilimonas sp. BCB1 TaxID=3152362 RepID=UPI0032D8C2CB